MPWSGRTPPLTGLSENPLSQALAERRSQGLPVLDLTASNPTTAGLRNDEGLAAFAGCAPERYEPDPRGPLAARQAMADYYQKHHGTSVSPGQLVLTASTSEAYSLLFKLVADMGDEVLVPVPSYPLLDALLQLDGLQAVPYPLHWEGDASEGTWSIDLAALSAALTERTRAVILVHPNNPTGHFVSQVEWTTLRNLAARHDLAIISDEVFADYRDSSPSSDLEAHELDPATPQLAPLAAKPGGAMVFSLSGLSKVCGLPQLKLGSILVGMHQGFRETMARLEYVNDAYLSANSAVLGAAPEILATAAGFQERLGARLRENAQAIQKIHTSHSLWNPLQRDGGWYVVLRVPRLAPDAELARELLAEHGVYTHPGSFFGFGTGRAHLVVSLLTPADTFRAGLERIEQSFASAPPGK